jgi:isoleucyl-tRNA synthetase
LREVRAAVEAGRLEPLPNGGYRAAGAELAADEVFVALKGREGYEVAGDQDVLVALDTSVTPELLAEGRARELSRKINELRREAGFEIADRIRVRYEAAPGWQAVIEGWASFLMAEALAVEIVPGAGASAWSGELDGEPVALELQRA